MRARLALAYTKQTVELREVVLKDKPPSLLSYSAKATVPVLVLPEGPVIDESLDIMHWALAKSDPDGWLEHADDAKTLILENDSQFKRYLDKYKYADRHPELSEQAHREHCYNFLDKLETRLQKQKYLSSDTLGLADMAIFPFIRQFAHVDLNWFEGAAWQAVKAWLDGCKSSALFKRIMTKYPAWKAGDPVTLFPSEQD